MGLTKPWAIALVILCTAFTSVGALCVKLGLNNFQPTSQGILDSYLVIVGIFFYFLGFLLLTIAFKYGELSTLFPFVSLSFIWVAVLSVTILHEKMNTLEMIGIAAIVVGVVMIGISGSQKAKMPEKKRRKRR